MTIYPLTLKNDHMFLELENGFWLVDTGAPSSFGSEITVKIEGIDYEINSSEYMGMTVGQLQESTGVELVGLLGGDILNNFDFIFDCPNEIVEISGNKLEHGGTSIKLKEFMEIPIISVRIRDREFKMFLDTGAQISYLQDEIIESFLDSGSMTDFYPGFGSFDTETYLVDIFLKDIKFSLRFGTLPLLLGMTLMIGGTEGILGNDVFIGRKVGYFPRRKLLVI